MRRGEHSGSLLSYRLSVPDVTAATTGDRWKCHPKSPPGATLTCTKTTLPGFDLMLSGCAILAAAKAWALIGGSPDADATPATTSAAASVATIFSFHIT